MPRIRSVHPNICESASLARISARAERTFVRLWTYCDDAGRARADARLLKAALYPLHDDISAADVRADVSELAKEGHVVLYSDRKWGEMLFVPSWESYQHPQRPSPSKFPPPPQRRLKPRGGVREPSASVPRGFPDGEGEGVGEGEGEGKEVREPSLILSAQLGADLAAAHPKRAPRRSAVPDSFVIDERVESWEAVQAARALSIDLERETERFLDHHRSNGKRFVDWDAAWRNWVSNAVRFEKARRSKAGSPFSVNGIPQ